MSMPAENKVLTGTWKDGRVVLDEPADWPEGSRIVVSPLIPARSTEGGADEQENDDPESIARWIDAFDAIPPLEMTPEEEARWQEARAAQKAHEIATFEERARRIEGLFP